VIIATAGHIDHGKTTLVHALTGVDPTRHAQARERGMTIDLGFAALETDDPEQAPIALVDVPGHEKFVHNMICGVAGVDAALLVIAADEGPMPQTIEHLRILDLLGIDTGLVALSRIDRCDAARIDQVRAEIRALAPSVFLSRAPVISVSAQSGEGVCELRQSILSLARARRVRFTAGRFRLAVDRSFTIAGAGLVVTGTVFSGRVGTGDLVHALRAGGVGRVRGIQVQHRHAGRAHAGTRCAINLASTALTAATVTRGEWIVAPPRSPLSRRLHVRLRFADHALAEQPRGSRQSLRLYLGAAEVGARLSLIRPAQAPAPDSSAGEETGVLAQLSLEQPLGAVFGDRFLLRDPAARITLGGGTVIDACPIVRLPPGVSRHDWLTHMERSDRAAALEGLLALAPHGLDLQPFIDNRNLDAAAIDAIFDDPALVVIRAGTVRHCFSPDHWGALISRLEAALEQWHHDQPEAAGMPLAQLLRPALTSLPASLLDPVCARLIAQGVLAHSPIGPRLPGFQPRFGEADEIRWQPIHALLEAGQARSPSALDIARQLKLPRHQIVEMLERAARLGRVTPVSEGRYFLPEALAWCVHIAGDVAGGHGGRLTAAQLRDASGLGRNLCVELLEHFDRTGLARRDGDAHVWVRGYQTRSGAQWRLAAGVAGSEVMPAPDPGVRKAGPDPAKGIA
jgi:selenocysteine-specific elongation factor